MPVVLLHLIISSFKREWNIKIVLFSSVPCMYIVAYNITRINWLKRCTQVTSIVCVCLVLGLGSSKIKDWDFCLLTVKVRRLVCRWWSLWLRSIDQTDIVDHHPLLSPQVFHWWICWLYIFCRLVKTNWVSGTYSLKQCYRWSTIAWCVQYSIWHWRFLVF